MGGFVLSRATRIETGLTTKPVANAIAIFKRDQREALTAEGEAQLTAFNEKCDYLELSTSSEFNDFYVEMMEF